MFKEKEESALGNSTMRFIRERESLNQTHDDKLEQRNSNNNTAFKIDSSLKEPKEATCIIIDRR